MLLPSPVGQTNGSLFDVLLETFESMRQEALCNLLQNGRVKRDWFHGVKSIKICGHCFQFSTQLTSVATHLLCGKNWGCFYL